MISETKLDESFPPGQFLFGSYSVGILLYIREDIPSKFLSINKNIECFFLEINFRNKTKWLPSCSHNPTKMQISNHFADLSESTDLYLTKYDQLLLLDDFNAGLKIHLLKIFVLVITLQVRLVGLHVLRSLRSLLA